MGNGWDGRNKMGKRAKRRKREAKKIKEVKKMEVTGNGEDSARYVAAVLAVQCPFVGRVIVVAFCQQ